MLSAVTEARRKLSAVWFPDRSDGADESVLERQRIAPVQVGFSDPFFPLFQRGLRYRRQFFRARGAWRVRVCAFRRARQTGHLHVQKRRRPSGSCWLRSMVFSASINPRWFCAARDRDCVDGLCDVILDHGDDQLSLLLKFE